jgi:hypothetical protein
MITAAPTIRSSHLFGGGRKRKLAFCMLLVVVAFALPVAADAPTSGPDKQYEDFDGQDRSIKDRFTKLVWDRPTGFYPGVKNWLDAKNSCPGTMRLPSLKELLTLVDEDPHEEYEVNRLVPKAIDKPAFSKTPTDSAFWTSSKKEGSNEYWTVNFADGTTGSAQATDTRRVRCVEFVP